MKRRDFVEHSALAIGGMALGGMFRNQGAEIMRRAGLQVYTVRGLMEQDFAGTLRSVAEIGYREIEFHDYYGNSPADVKSLIDELGLTSPSIHVSLDVLRSDLTATIKTATLVGQKYIVCPWLSPELRSSSESYRRLAAEFNEIGRACKDAGIQFAYHNHDFEFEEIDGEIPYEILLHETEPELVEMELDIFWSRKGGHPASDLVQQFPGRFSLCHVKDMDPDGNMVSVGDGVIDFSEIIELSETAGLKHFFVEHDNPEDPMDSIRRSYSALDTLFG